MAPGTVRAARGLHGSRNITGLWSALLIACGAGCGTTDLGIVALDASASGSVGDAASAHLDAQVADAARGTRDAADAPGSGPGSRDAEATIAVCGAQPDQRCADDAGVADAGHAGPDLTDAAAVGSARCDGGAGRGCDEVSCDVRLVMCKRAPPKCAGGDVPAVVDTCYGDCVPVEQCACHAAAECPMPEQYACHMSAAHCGPYVN